MDVKMEDVIQEKACIVEELLEIDFDYEFDVAKFFDFTKIETSEEIMESELWFEFFQGHLPSRKLLIKFKSLFTLLEIKGFGNVSNFHL